MYLCQRTTVFILFYKGNCPNSPDNLANHDRRGRTEGQGGQMWGTSDGKQPICGSRSPICQTRAGLLQYAWQEEEETQEKAQNGAAQGGANHPYRRGGGAV